jgi:hypothetical protein
MTAPSNKVTSTKSLVLTLKCSKVLKLFNYGEPTTNPQYKPLSKFLRTLKKKQTSTNEKLHILFKKIKISYTPSSHPLFKPNHFD